MPDHPTLTDGHARSAVVHVDGRRGVVLFVSVRTQRAKVKLTDGIRTRHEWVRAADLSVIDSPKEPECPTARTPPCTTRAASSAPTQG